MPGGRVIGFGKTMNPGGFPGPAFAWIGFASHEIVRFRWMSHATRRYRTMNIGRSRPKKYIFPKTRLVSNQEIAVVARERIAP